MLYRDTISSSLGGVTPYVKHKLQCHAHYDQILKSLTSFTGASLLRLFCTIGVIRAIAPFVPLGINIIKHHPHTRLSSGHGFDTN